jgi:hypothetical protein
MHLVDNLVPLSSWITDNKAMEHFVCLWGFSNHETLLDLEDLFVFGKRLLLNSFSASVLYSGNSKKALFPF